MSALRVSVNLIHFGITALRYFEIYIYIPVGGGNESQKHPSCNQAFTKAMDAEKQRLF